MDMDVIQLWNGRPNKKLSSHVFDGEPGEVSQRHQGGFTEVYTRLEPRDEGRNMVVIANVLY